MFAPALATGSLGILLSAGLHVLGLLEPLDSGLAALVALDPATAAAAVPAWVVWLATAGLAYGLAIVLLEIPGTWRRVVIWLSTIAVVAGWLPVAAISGSHAQVAAPAVAVVWSGICAIIYASRHRMAADDDLRAEPATPDGDPPKQQSSDGAG